MGAQDRWVHERASWVLARAGRNPAARRRGERLMAAARKIERHVAGAGDSSSSEVATRNLWHRLVFREEGTANIVSWFFITAAWMFVTVMAVGPGLLLARTIYGGWWLFVPRIGRLKSWPLLAGGAAIAVVGVGALWLWPPSSGVAAFFTGYLLIQLVVGTLRAAWLVRAYGWKAVASQVKASSKRITPVVINIPVVDDETEAAQRSATAQTALGAEPVEKPIAIVVELPDHHDEFDFAAADASDDEEYDEHNEYDAAFAAQEGGRL